MPTWHQLVSMSGHVEESETARKLQLYATSIYQVHSFVCQLDYKQGLAYLNFNATFESTKILMPFLSLQKNLNTIFEFTKILMLFFSFSRMIRIKIIILRQLKK